VKTINATEILLTPTKRERYDKKLIEQGIYTSKKEVKKQENSRVHYDEAIKLIDEGKLQQARNAIQIALQIEPENREYIAAKEQIAHINKQNAVKILLLRLEKNETLMWDERILQKTLTQLFEINNYTSTRIKVAKILVEKKAFAVALEVLREAAPTDKDTRNEISALQKDIKKRYKAYQAQF
jgi:tetratricopeptide (TPR) repeat protein